MFSTTIRSIPSRTKTARFITEPARRAHRGLPPITQITDVSGTVTIRFTSQDGDDTTSSFTLLSSGNTGTALHVDTVVAGATFTQLGTGAFQVTTPATTNKAVAFYRIEHSPSPDAQWIAHGRWVFPGAPFI